MHNQAVAVAIRVHQNTNPFKALVESTANIGSLVFDFMYGTPERCKMTYAFAIGFTILGFALQATEAAAIANNCSITSL